MSAFTGESRTGRAQHWNRILRVLDTAADGYCPGAPPFGPGDATAGTETELQADVVGDRERVDLPRWIEASSYYANILRRSAAEDTPKRSLRDLERFLDNRDRVWDHSWVRLPRRVLCLFARAVFEQDLLADKASPAAGLRSDAGRFVLSGVGSGQIRAPVSYLLKLALASVLGASPGSPVPSG